MDTRIITADDWRAIARRLPAPPPDSLAPGARVEKIKSEPGDSQPIGARGTVIVALPEVRDMGVGYVIEWDQIPGIAALVIGWKVTLAPKVH